MDYQALIKRWQNQDLRPWADCLPDQLAASFQQGRHGDLPRWRDALNQLPELQPAIVDLTGPSVRVGSAGQASTGERQQLEAGLRRLCPWRKGPYELFGLSVDSEWRSDLKWARLEQALTPLAGRRVLDVGCGNGYHCWRMRGAGAGEVIGIDPAPLFIVQFWAVQKYIADPAVWVLPLGIEQAPNRLEAFDSVFSMGILYHRRSPMDHLQALQGCLRTGGELILETLVVEGDERHCLVPRGRYARMSNIWFIPSCEMLTLWLDKLGFRDIRQIDVTATTSAEQRTTGWMQFQSLADFLDPQDQSLTVEGYPAPRRGIFMARK